MLQQILLAPHVSTYNIGTTFSVYIIGITLYGLYYIIGIISYGLYYWYRIYGVHYWHHMFQHYYWHYFSNEYYWHYILWTILYYWYYILWTILLVPHIWFILALHASTNINGTTRFNIYYWHHIISNILLALLSAYVLCFFILICIISISTTSRIS